MAYASKYYDPVKAHEYYIKHRKLKGRQKRASKAGLNETGVTAADEVKERLNEEMKAELAKLPKRGAKEARAKIREKYKEMYLDELDKIKQDTALQKQKAAKKERVKAEPKEKQTKSKSEAKQKQTESKSKANAKQNSGLTLEANTLVSEIRSKAKSMSEEERKKLRSRVNDLIQEISKRLQS